MPLKNGYSRKTFNDNYRIMRDDGHPHDQALAACYKNARSSFFKAYPDGALPEWLVPKDGRRLKNPVPRKRKESPEMKKLLLDAESDGFPQGSLWRNIDARPSRYELDPDYNSGLRPGEPTSFDKYIRPGKNPVPPSSRAHEKRRVSGDAENARLLYEKFTGHDGVDEVLIDKPIIPDVMCVIGNIDGIMYTTMRDGKTEKYLHKFKKNARPLFCVSPDGLSLHLIGGSYQFGERGIEDF